ncbi:hypothetical protein CVT25_004705 [Psilocybe cyanescens]|uniref:Uncharacterized protein n=1 Tax=Psilocybe cyanescens TaxID=93625 RepID=A0A409XIT9_PSICY|nr:hypothetical protein CVT25_004705 [Psilocybe cyanescens]
MHLASLIIINNNAARQLYHPLHPAYHRHVSHNGPLLFRRVIGARLHFVCAGAGGVVGCGGACAHACAPARARAWALAVVHRA